jgi:hypothetical protein
MQARVSWEVEGLHFAHDVLLEVGVEGVVFRKVRQIAVWTTAAADMYGVVWLVGFMVGDGRAPGA